MTKRQFKDATAFRASLEERLKSHARKEGTDLQRLRRQVAFDRLLARLFSGENPPWYLKGGYAMELRIHGARTTRVVDLGRSLEPGEKTNRPKLLEEVQAFASHGYGKFVGAKLKEGGQHHQVLLGRDFLENVVMIYDGIRSQVTIAAPKKI